MKAVKKQYVLSVCILSVTLLMSGCKTQKNKDPVTTEPDEEPVVSESLFSDYMYSEDENGRQIKLGYEGTNEYRHTLTFESEEVTGDAVRFLYNGTISGQASDDTEFLLSYQISTEKAVESFEQVKTKDQDGETTTKHFSKINDFVAMQGEIATGTTWTQDVNIDNRSYVATTEITELSGDKLTTVTTVPNIEDYLDGLYKETRTYEKGKGLTAFERSTPITHEPFRFVLAYTMEGDKIVYIDETYRTDEDGETEHTVEPSEDDDYVETDHNTSTEDGEVWYAPEEGE